ncbi:unnamed protein product [Rhizoctonia solani]|uniref:Uncharacterized protein n=1 Tax=Rhizoctonia solani TaxID=456999 RepID=A0A8H3E0X9_9AGAM|nr:unnamed protein product [Rhizoctonia solani]
MQPKKPRSRLGGVRGHDGHTNGFKPALDTTRGNRERSWPDSLTSVRLSKRHEESRDRGWERPAETRDYMSATSGSGIDCQHVSRLRWCTPACPTLTVSIHPPDRPQATSASRSRPTVQNAQLRAESVAYSTCDCEEVMR